MVDNQTQAAAAAQLIETWTDAQLVADFEMMEQDVRRGKYKYRMTWADAVSLVDIACQVASKNGLDGPQLRQAMHVITKGCQ